MEIIIIRSVEENISCVDIGAVQIWSLEFCDQCWGPQFRRELQGKWKEEELDLYTAFHLES